MVRSSNSDPRSTVDARIERAGDLLQPDLLGNMERAGDALHEWLGLAIYRLQGRTRELFPAP